MKTLVTGKAKLAIADVSYSGEFYQESLRTLERKFGQPQVVVGAYLDKLNSYPALKMHNSDNIINFASVISSLDFVLHLFLILSNLIFFDDFSP